MWREELTSVASAIPCNTLHSRAQQQPQHKAGEKLCLCHLETDEGCAGPTDAFWEASTFHNSFQPQAEPRVWGRVLSGTEESDEG